MTPIPSFARALATALLAFVATTLTASAATVTGTIRASDTGLPLGSKVVAAYDLAGTLRGSATSDQTGTYILALPEGGYRILAYDIEGIYATRFDGDAESFETSPVTDVPAAGTVRRDFFLSPGGSISGVVVRSNGTAAGGYTVEAYNLSGTRRAFTTTDLNGRYSIVLPPGEYKVIAYDPGGDFSFSFYPAVRTFAEAERVRVTASRVTAEVDFRLERAGRLTGVAVDLATGQPVSAIYVYAYTPEGVQVTETPTDAGGTFRLSLPPGEYRLVAADPAHRYATAFYGLGRAFETSPVLHVLAGGAQANIQIGLMRAATIAGRIRDSGGAPVGNVSVAAYNLDGTMHASAVTDAEGEYEVLVAPGGFKLLVFDRQLVYATAFFGGARDFASTGTLGIAAGQAIRGFDFVLVRGARVSGTVRDGVQPRAGITVAAYDSAHVLAGSAVTAVDGTYALVVRAGNYRILAFDDSLRYAPAYDLGAASFDQTIPRPVAEGASVMVDLSLRRAVTVTAFVLDTAGEFVSGVNVCALDEAGNRVSGAPAMNGVVNVAVPAGSYRFVAIDPERRFAVTYWERSATLAGATVVAVGDGHVPQLSFVLEQVTKRRGVRS